MKESMSVGAWCRKHRISRARAYERRSWFDRLQRAIERGEVKPGPAFTPRKVKGVQP